MSEGSSPGAAGLVRIRIRKAGLPSVPGSESSPMAVSTAACPPVPTDEQLLARLARGDRAALEELFRRYRGVAYRVAHRLLGNDADALDAVQEGFANALTHLPRFQVRRTFKHWLLRL